MMTFNKNDLALHISAAEKQLSIRRQCELMGVSRSSYYFVAQGESEENLLLMKLIDRQHLKMPFWGYPRMTDHLRDSLGIPINEKRVHRLMRLMRIQSVLPSPNTSQPNEAHKVYPYLLNGLDISAPNQVWATDITYIPMEKGFLYLTAVIDWHSRFILSWQLSNSMEVGFCLDALGAAWKYGQPDIFNTDQGSQYTSLAFTGELLQRDIKISMDGKGRALDNRMIERFWWTLKYEHVYLYAFENGKDLYLSLVDFFDYYNYKRPHSSLEKRTPAEVFFATQVESTHGQS